MKRDVSPWFWLGYMLGVFVLCALAVIFDVAYGAKPPKQRCTVSCFTDREPVICIYDEVDRCSGVICVDSEAIRCEPRVKNLGEWEPVTNPSAPTHRRWWN